MQTRFYFSLRATLVALVLALVCSWHMAPAYAQDDGEEAAEEVQDEAQGDAGREKDVAGAQDAEDVQRTSYLEQCAEALGWGFGPIFLIISFTFVALLVMNLLTAKRENVIPKELVEQFEQHLNDKQFQEAYELAKGDESLLGHILSAGLSKVSTGYNEAIEAMQEVGEVENMRLEHRLSYLALIGTLSPMVGLLGTVYGMIDSFSLIADTSTGSPNPQALAAGISTALFTTLVGLALAIPALASYNLLRNRVALLVVEVGIISEGLMSRFQKKPA